MIACLKMSDPVGLTMAGKIDVMLILGKGEKHRFRCVPVGVYPKEVNHNTNLCSLLKKTPNQEKPEQVLNITLQVMCVNHAIPFLQVWSWIFLNCPRWSMEILSPMNPVGCSTTRLSSTTWLEPTAWTDTSLLELTFLPSTSEMTPLCENQNRRLIVFSPAAQEKAKTRHQILGEPKY